MPGINGGTIYRRVVGTREDKTVEPSDPRSIIVEPTHSVRSPTILPTSRSSFPTLS